MRGIVRASLASPVVQEASRNASIGLSRCDASRSDRAYAIYRWIKTHIKFEQDENLVDRMFGSTNRNPFGEDFLITPQALLLSSNPSGDCDDFSMLGAAMLMIANVPARFVTIAGDQDNPSIFSHVYLEFLSSANNWCGFDASHGNRLGWSYPYATRKQVWLI